MSNPKPKTRPSSEKVLDDVQAWMETRSGKPVSREDARQAAENLAGVGRLLIDWIKRADATDPGWRERARAPALPKASTDASKANTKE
jgi:hypothetical protein